MDENLNTILGSKEMFLYGSEKLKNISVVGCVSQKVLCQTEKLVVMTQSQKLNIG